MSETAVAAEPEPHHPQGGDKAGDGRPPVEIVSVPQPGTDLERRNETIEQVTDAALAMPGAPGRDEFLALAMQARLLSMSGAAPRAVRGNPYLALHLAVTGRDLGISPSAALNLVDVIQGRDGPQLSLSPQLMNGQIRRLGLGSIVPGERTDLRAVAVVLEPNGHLDPRCGHTLPDEHVDGCACVRVMGASEFTWEDARMAGLVGPDCQPGAHTPDCLAWKKGVSCNQGYKAYPKRMLWWRAAGFAADDWFPEAGLGLYSAEALGAVVDDEGRPIDPASVALPDGYEPTPTPPNPNDVPLAEADSAANADLRARVDAITDAHPDARAALAELWQHRDEQGVVALPPFGRLRFGDRQKAKAMVASVEQRIRKGEWGDDTTARWTAARQERPAVVAQDAPRGPGGTDTADDTPDAPTADQGAGSDDDQDAIAAYDAAVARPIGQTDAVEALSDEQLAELVQADVNAMTLADVLATLDTRSDEFEEIPDTPERQRILLMGLLFGDRQTERDRRAAIAATDERIDGQVQAARARRREAKQDPGGPTD